MIWLTLERCINLFQTLKISQERYNFQNCRIKWCFSTVFLKYISTPPSIKVLKTFNWVLVGDMNYVVLENRTAGIFVSNPVFDLKNWSGILFSSFWCKLELCRPKIGRATVLFPNWPVAWSLKWDGDFFCLETRFWPQKHITFSLLIILIQIWGL